MKEFMLKYYVISDWFSGSKFLSDSKNSNISILNTTLFINEKKVLFKINIIEQGCQTHFHQGPYQP